MTAPFKTWTVQPHGELTRVGDRIFTVVGDIRMPIGNFPRRMTVVRLANGDLIIYSAIALDEPHMAQLEAFGRPAFMIVPSERHRLDAPGYASRYPSIRVITPTRSRDKVAEVVFVDASAITFSDPSVRYIEVPGTKQTEAALEITDADGVTLVVNEIIGDIHGAHGLKGWLLKLMGFAGEEPHIPAPVKMMFSKEKTELAAQLHAWSQLPNLRRIIASHGDIIDADPQGVLRKLADGLE